MARERDYLAQSLATATWAFNHNNFLPVRADADTPHRIFPRWRNVTTARRPIQHDLERRHRHFVRAAAR